MSSILTELRRRNVFKVAAVYVIAGWLILQVVDVLFPALKLPEWTITFVAALLIIGLPIALIFAWAFEITPEGVKREKHVDRSQSITQTTGRKLDFIIIGLMAVAIAYFSYDKFVLQRDATGEPVAEVAGYEKSVAVIPFASLGSEEESEFFAAGIHDDLLTQLAKIADLRVISRTSVLEYANTTKNMREISQELGVKHILEGGVQKAGKRVRINVQLINAETDTHLWAETFDRELTTENIFEIQSEIARSITGALQVTLLPEAAEAIAKPPTDNVEAYRDYLAGMKILFDLDVDNAEETARELFQSAVEKDPQFALAWVRLADAWQSIFWQDPEQPNAIDKSVETLRRATEIDPDLPEIHLVRGFQQYHGYLNYEEALRELELAERGLPGNVEVFLWRGYIYRRMDQMPEMLAAFENALRLDPRNPDSISQYGDGLMRVRRYEESRALFENAITAFPDTFAFRWGSADVDFYQHGSSDAYVRIMSRPDLPGFEEYEEAFTWFAWLAGDIETALRHSRRIVNDQISFRDLFLVAEEIKGFALGAAGELEQARQLFETALVRMEQIVAENPDDANRLQALARVHAFLGNNDEAVRIANEALAKFDKQEDVPLFQGFRVGHGQILCQVGAFQPAEDEFRWLLSRVNRLTLAYLVKGWPPCKAIFVDTENYRRLEQEFGHLSEGVKGP